MAKENKEAKSNEETTNEGFAELAKAMNQDRESSDKKFIKIFDVLSDYKVLETKFKLYEKILGLIALAIVYGIVDKFF